VTPAFSFFMFNHQRILPLLALPLLCSLYSRPASATESSAKSAAAPAGQHALDLAKSGHCAEAIPLLKQAITQSSDKELHRNAGLEDSLTLLKSSCARCGESFQTIRKFSTLPSTPILILRLALLRNLPYERHIQRKRMN
jgi:hypothetical protein